MPEIIFGDLKTYIHILVTIAKNLKHQTVLLIIILKFLEQQNHKKGTGSQILKENQVY